VDSLDDLQSQTQSVQPYTNNNANIPAPDDQLSKPSTPLKFSLRNVINQLKGDYDYVKIDQQKAILYRLETELTDLMIKIEHHVQDIISCLHRNIVAYNAAEVASERYRTFDELTARLGNGFLPSVAYDDWRRTGCPGIRPIILNFLQHVQRIAEERLTLEELYLPGGRDWKTMNNPERNRSKWIIMWHERNIVLKVLHW
jgi:cellulose biosynthesis protein BcsQ